MTNSQKVEILLIRIRSLIADKEAVVATANRENALGGWLWDHNEHLNSINGEINQLHEELTKY